MDDSLRSELQPPDPTPGHGAADNSDVSLKIPDSVIPAHLASRWLLKIRLGKIILFVTSLYLFILAITLMKSGARGFAPLARGFFPISTGINSLGFGWLFAYLIMSGSPVAAAALTFFDAGLIDGLGAFAMITGSRLGAGFIVLFIGFIYVLRGRDWATSLSMGTLTLTVTATTYLPGLILGVFMLNTGLLDGIQIHSGMLLISAIDKIVQPIASLSIELLPPWAIFLVGLAIILISFNLFDKCLPQMTLKESQLGWISRLVYRPMVMFTLGAVVTMISMSISISLSLLVPLSHRGFVRRENVIPYIMGANITTFIDTLLAAILLNNHAAFSIVLVEMVSVLAISIIILAIFYPNYQRSMLNFISWVTASTRNLVIFMITILTVPVILILV